MNDQNDTHLHPVDDASALEGTFRRLLQNPERILKKYIRQGMRVLDLGCGSGFFTLEMARLVGEEGKVIAVDVQEGMLELLKEKLENCELRQRIQLFKSETQSLGFTDKVDFILVFYSFHEMKYIDHIIQGLTEIVKPDTQILISEQKMHVSKEMFASIVNKMINKGFVVYRRPKIFFSRSVVMKVGK